MAYQFVRASSQHLSTDSSPVSSGIGITLAVRAYSSNTTNDQRAFSTTRVNNNTWVEVGFAGDVAGTPVLCEQRVGITIRPVYSSSAYSANTWYSIAGYTTSTSNRSVALNGVVVSDATSGTTDVTNLERLFVARNRNGLYLDGGVAEVALWNVLLTADEIVSLSKGFKAARIRPQSLKFYAPIVRNLQDLREGLTITNNNTATVADHPRVY